MTNLIVALDFSEKDKIIQAVNELSQLNIVFKIGLEAINSIGGKEAVKIIQEAGGEVFYDAKFNDIPNTMAKAVKAISVLGVKSISIHASSGKESIKAAIKNKGNSEIWLVTVLTAFTEEDSLQIFNNSPLDQVLKFVELGKELGVEGIICSPLEAKYLRENDKFINVKIITPGIRPTWAATNDQSRIMTPKEASCIGINYLVIGRPITSPPNSLTPFKATELLLKEINNTSYVC